jgi:hypothetical protein
MQPPAEHQLPSPAEYIKCARKMESECEQYSDDAFSTTGSKAPECIANLLALFVRMDAVSSCFWCCLGGNHQLEYMAGRLVSSARGSLSLLRKGFYDESLNLTRSMGETANLLVLFWHDRLLYERWSTVDASTRRKEFAPVKVRLALEAKKLPVPIDEERYSALSEVATHVTPNTRPNAHNQTQRPKLGGHFDLASAVAALNELAYAFAVGSFAVVQIIDLPPAHKKDVMRCAREVLNSVGGVSVVALCANVIAKSQDEHPDAI